MRNAELAAKISNEIRTKYFWFDFSVAVYNPLDGFQDHAFDDNSSHAVYNVRLLEDREKVIVK